MTLIPIIELCHYCPGIVTATGGQHRPGRRHHHEAGHPDPEGALGSGPAHPRQGRRLGHHRARLRAPTRWAACSPSAKRDGDEYVLNGNKTFITNGPYADTIVFYAKLDDGDGVPIRERKVLTFVLDKGMPGFEQSKPFRKMGLHSSPTGELFLTDVRVGKDRLLGGAEDRRGGGGRDIGQGQLHHRAGRGGRHVARASSRSASSSRSTTPRTACCGSKPIGELQLIQLKLAKMEVARLNVQNLVFRHIELSAAGKSLTLAEASAMKLYSAQAASEVAMEAVQLFGGNGYMAEYRVEQLARDAKVFQIYAGTDEIQVTHIAKDLLSR